MTTDVARPTIAPAATSENLAMLPPSEQMRLFFTTLFEPSDLILFRPIETWTDSDGRKRSNVLYKSVRHRRLGVCDNDRNWSWQPNLWESLARSSIQLGEKSHANIFFGVCPRFGSDGKYDKAWQIRNVRCVWADLDGVSVEEAVKRCHKNQVPMPTVVVSTGNGVHFYWKLSEPFLIDDVPDPLPILRSRTLKNARGKSESVIIDPTNGKKEIPYSANIAPPMSNKALHIQSIMQGINAVIGGDHTKDLSRILRVPGTANRKNERNGDAAKPCSLISIS